MSKNNNVNPGQYKVAGRERPGEDVLASAHKAALTQAEAQQRPAPRQSVTPADSGDSESSTDKHPR
jgi:hypothetical protein